MKMQAAMIALSIGLGTAASADVVAYWDQNSNDLGGGLFGFTPADFPQPADQGTGTLTLEDFDMTVGANGAYSTIQSFGGSTENALPAVASGGSLSPQGGDDGTGAQSNNGMSIVLTASTTGLEDVIVSWAQRGTSTGFNSRAFSYSTDGVNYTLVDTDTGALGSTFVTESYDLSSITALDDAPAVFFKITLDGATSATGNNRFDNILIEASVIPEPASVVLMGLGAVAMLRRRNA